MRESRFRNDPLAAKAVQVLVSNIVGTGIRPRAAATDPALNKLADDLWKRWAPRADVDVYVLIGGDENEPDRQLAYRADRRPLIEGIHAIAKDTAGLSYLQDRYPEGGTGPLRDICPFTAMGTFNRSMTDANRRLIAGALAKLIGVEEEPRPASS